jgi:hypothetical protein
MKNKTHTTISYLDYEKSRKLKEYYEQKCNGGKKIAISTWRTYVSRFRKAGVDFEKPVGVIHEQIKAVMRIKSAYKGVTKNSKLLTANAVRKELLSRKPFTLNLQQVIGLIEEYVKPSSLNKLRLYAAFYKAGVSWSINRKYSREEIAEIVFHAIRASTSVLKIDVTTEEYAKLFQVHL